MPSQPMVKRRVHRRDLTNRAVQVQIRRPNSEPRMQSVPVLTDCGSKDLNFGSRTSGFGFRATRISDLARRWMGKANGAGLASPVSCLNFRWETDGLVVHFAAH